jgi:hypothetical protein
MQYVNYEKDIVIKYGVALEGWTHPTWANPSDLSTSLPPLQALANAVKNGTCHFRTLTPEERQQRETEYFRKATSGEIVQRKIRKDKGTRREQAANEPPGAGSNPIQERYTRKTVDGKNVVVIDTDLPSSETSSSSDDGNDLPLSSKRRRIRDQHEAGAGLVEM